MSLPIQFPFLVEPKALPLRIQASFLLQEITPSLAERDIWLTYLNVKFLFFSYLFIFNKKFIKVACPLLHGTPLRGMTTCALSALDT